MNIIEKLERLEGFNRHREGSNIMQMLNNLENIESQIEFLKKARKELLKEMRKEEKRIEKLFNETTNGD